MLCTDKDGNVVKDKNDKTVMEATPGTGKYIPGTEKFSHASCSVMGSELCA